MTQRYCLGIIGGSGFSAFDGIESRTDIHHTTPYGAPSGMIVRFSAPHADVLFLPRHGKGHRIPPHEVNYRANICALRELGATHVVSVSAMGSLREHLAPGSLVAVDQIVDRTHGRAASFFDGTGIAAHVSFADPVCPFLHAALGTAFAHASGLATGTLFHASGTLVVINGPRFSSRAESEGFRSLGADVIGMTAMPEAALAREAELPYAILGCVTDYDCWHTGHAAVTADAVAAVMRANATAAQAVVRALLAHLPDPTQSPAHRALDSAIMTDLAQVTDAARASLRWLRPFAPANGTA